MYITEDDDGATRGAGTNVGTTRGAGTNIGTTRGAGTIIITSNVYFTIH